jgi:RNA polymerase sigma factor (sigma-70 family)
MEQPNTEDIHSLVKKCLQGNHKAQYDLYHAFSKAMYNTCLRFLSDSRDAEEALQNAFILIFKNMESFRGDATIGAWIKKIVIYQCINKLKEKNLVYQDLSSHHFEIPDKESNYEQQLEYNQSMIPIITEAVAALPTGYKTVCNLYLFEGYDHEEIANILNISVATSKSQYSRAKQKIRETLRK